MGLIRIQLDAEGNVLNAPAETGDLYPDDTVTRVEDRRGRERPHGALRIAGPKHQPPGWARRAARQWDGRTRTWVATGTPPEARAPEQARQRLRLAQIPDAPTPEETAALLRDMRRMLIHIQTTGGGDDV